MKSIAAIVAVALLQACLWLIPSGATAATMSASDIQQTYNEATDLFRKANEAASTSPQEAKDLYGKAAMRFERLATDGGIHGGELYYNIGNAYFRMNDLGRAILNYRLAEQYTPGDPNLIQNLEYARSRRMDKIETRQQTKMLETVFFWHYDLPRGTRRLIFACCFAAFWIGMSVRLFLRKAAPRWALVCLAILAVSFLTSLAVDAVTLSRSAPGVILADEVVARKGDGESYEPAFKESLHAGTEFALVENRSDWLQVELADGRQCWLPRTTAALVKP